MVKSKENDDVPLWDNFRNGDDAAYTLIYKKYVSTLYAQGSQFTRDKEIVQDGIQEVFTRIYKNRSNLSPTDNIKKYLMASMRNQMLLMLSKEKVRADMLLYKTSEQDVEESVEEVIISMEDMAVLRREIDSILSLLTGRQREAMYYRYIECLDMDEICLLMDLNYQSLRNILFRSFKKIRGHLKIISEK